MSSDKGFCIKLIHCGNKNIANPKDNAQKNVFFMPMGFCALGGILKEKQFDVEIIHSDLIDNELFSAIDYKNVDAVGFDCHWANQSLSVIETAELLKRINPDIFVFLGGYTASLFSEEIVQDFPQVDAVLRGDGEVPIGELCEVLHKSKVNGKYEKSTLYELLGNVQNLVWKGPQGNVVKNGFTYIGTGEQIDKLDFAALDVLKDWEQYKMLCKFWTRFDEINSGPLFFLCVGRGCQYACLFCGGNCEAQRRMNNRSCVAVRSIDSVIRTIKEAVARGFKTMYTCFEYEGSENWYIELLERIKEEKLDINFVYGSWKLPSNKLIDAFSRCCSNVLMEISPETGVEELRKINKDSRLYYSNSELEDCLDFVSTKKNVRIQLYYGYFLVKDTEETITDTLKYIMKLSLKYSDFVEQEYFNFSTDPGSLIFFYPEKYDIEMNVRKFSHYLDYIRETYVNSKGSSADLRVFNPKNMPVEVVNEIERKIRLLNHLFTNYRGTVSTILRMTNNPEAIVNLLKDNTLLDSPEQSVSPDEFKELLVNACNKNNCLDVQLLKIISIECERQKQEFEAAKPAPQIWLEHVNEGTLEGSKAVEAMMEYVNLKSNSFEDDMDFDFDSLE